MPSRYGADTVISGEKYVAFTPKIPTGRPGIIYCHSSYGLTTETLTYAGLREIIAALVVAGYPVLACDLSGTPGGASAWANPSSLTKVATARSYLQASMGAKAGKVGLLGLSMGGATSLVWAGRNPTLASCVVGLIPVVNITDIHTNNRSGAAADINTAYGGTWSEATYGAQHNPQTIATAGAYSSIPIRTYYGSTDTICVPATQTAFAAASGAVATQYTGDHSSTTVSQVSPAEVLAFYDAHT